MKRAIVLLVLSLAACQSTSAPRVVNIAVLDTPAGHSHSQKVVEVIESNYAGSCGLEVRHFPIYVKGNLTVEAFRSAIRNSREFSPDVTNISWNTIYRSPYDVIVRNLEKVSATGFLVTAAGDDPVPGDISGLSGTVMGKVPGALVIGALSKSGRPASRRFRNELLTAIAPPEGTLGSSFAAALFTAKLAERICQDDELDFDGLLESKRRLKKKYPSLEELLNN